MQPWQGEIAKAYMWHKCDIAWMFAQTQGTVWKLYCKHKLGKSMLLSKAEDGWSMYGMTRWDPRQTKHTKDPTTWGTMSRREDARKLWSLLLDIGDGQRKSRSEEALLDFFLPSAHATLFAKAGENRDQDVQEWSIGEIQTCHYHALMKAAKCSSILSLQSAAWRETCQTPYHLPLPSPTAGMACFGGNIIKTWWQDITRPLNQSAFAPCLLRRGYYSRKSSMPVELVIRFKIFSCKVDCLAFLDISFFRLPKCCKEWTKSASVRKLCLRWVWWSGAWIGSESMGMQNLGRSTVAPVDSLLTHGVPGGAISSNLSFLCSTWTNRFLSILGWHCRAKPSMNSFVAIYLIFGSHKAKVLNWPRVHYSQPNDQTD